MSTVAGERTTRTPFAESQWSALIGREMGLIVPVLSHQHRILGDTILTDPITFHVGPGVGRIEGDYTYKENLRPDLGTGGRMTTLSVESVDLYGIAKGVGFSVQLAETEALQKLSINIGDASVGLKRTKGGSWEEEYTNRGSIFKGVDENNTNGHFFSTLVAARTIVSGAEDDLVQALSRAEVRRLRQEISLTRRRRRN